MVAKTEYDDEMAAVLAWHWARVDPSTLLRVFTVRGLVSGLGTPLTAAVHPSSFLPGSA